MAPPVACLSPSGRLPRAAAARIATETGSAALTPFSLSRYLAAPRPPARLVLCPAGRSVAADLRFLDRVALRLLWRPPPAGFEDAIAGIREPAAGHSPRGRRARSSAAPIAAALLLEGRVGPERARAALAAKAPPHWIVENARSVCIPERGLRALARSGVRWAALEPVEVLGLCATPALAQAVRRGRPFLPPRTRIWIRPLGTRP